MATLRQKKAFKDKRERQADRLLRVFHVRPIEESYSYVYIMKCDEFYKIGTTFDLDNRHNSLQCGNPYLIEIVMAIRVPDAKVAERELQNLFIDKRVVREWFALSNKDVVSIREFLESSWKYE